ncbi:hypothetical protein EVAR_25678_1 [Eumeta japonica]|uniref:Uncharacterized protein n=1 Tax=Eumeta variegata TaxID=151549 RepID=A0A4C1WH42_EUMVA|nr:hypothetical protein EVAR_25678_1 [Eumeta japonica]
MVNDGQQVKCHAILGGAAPSPPVDQPAAPEAAALGPRAARDHPRPPSALIKFRAVLCCDEAGHGSLD